MTVNLNTARLEFTKQAYKTYETYRSFIRRSGSNKLSFRLSLFCFWLWPFQSAHAADLITKTRVYSYSCTHYTYILGEAEIFYRDLNIPKSAQITVAAGWSGYRMVQDAAKRKVSRLQNDNKSQQPIIWADRIEVPMTLSQSNVWTANLAHALAQKGSNEYFMALDFIFEIRLPGGKVYLDKGSASRISFYRSIFRVNSPIPCVDFGITPPDYFNTDWTVIKKD